MADIKLCDTVGHVDTDMDALGGHTGMLPDAQFYLIQLRQVMSVSVSALSLLFLVIRQLNKQN